MTEYTPFDDVNTKITEEKLAETSNKSTENIQENLLNLDQSDPVLSPDPLPKMQKAAFTPIRARANSQPAILYKMFNENNELLWVGVTGDLQTVISQFNTTKEWFHEVKDITKLTTTRPEAFRLRKQILSKEGSKYNKRSA